MGEEEKRVALASGPPVLATLRQGQWRQLCSWGQPDECSTGLLGLSVALHAGAVGASIVQAKQLQYSNAANAGIQGRALGIAQAGTLLHAG